MDITLTHSPLSDNTLLPDCTTEAYTFYEAALKREKRYRNPFELYRIELTVGGDIAVFFRSEPIQMH